MKIWKADIFGGAVAVFRFGEDVLPVRHEGLARNWSLIGDTKFPGSDA